MSSKQTTSWPVFDSIEQCASQSGLPKERLRAWKADGAPGFRGSRVYLADLLPWACAKLSDKGAAVEPIIETWSDKLDKQKFEERAGILVEYEKAMDILRSALMPVRQWMLGLPSTLSARCNPSDPEHARQALEAAIEQGMRMLSDGEKAKMPK
jgi:hypothetical protein